MSVRRDRGGRVTRYFHDALGRLTGTRDPLGRTIGQTWCSCGALDALVDGKGNRTSWVRDARGRVTQEIRANGSGSTYTYGPVSGRLQTVEDAKAQVTTYTYALDDAVLGMTFTNALVATPSVGFTYEAGYPRMATMVDGTGTTAYSYVGAGTEGGGQVATVDGPLSNDTITYTYDALGRATNRDINGTGVTWGFDALGRITSEVNVLGTFTYGYAGVTPRLSSVTYPNGQTSAYSYYGGTDDRRLETIHHKYPGGATLSKFDYTYDAVGNIMTWLQQADSDPPVHWVYGYDVADQLISAVKGTTGQSPEVLATYRYGYDAAANRTFEQVDDLITLATYDNMNRLLAHVPGGSLAIEGLINEAATVTIQGSPATVTELGEFRGAVPVTGGTNSFTIVATDASGNVRTQPYEVGISGQTRLFVYDANGNLNNDGLRTLSWNVRNQLVLVEVGSRQTAFSYDGMQRRVGSLEQDGESVQSDTRFVWCEGVPCEARDSDGTVVIRRSFDLGESTSVGAQFWALDHLFTPRDSVDSNGVLRSRLEFDPWGRRTVQVGEEAEHVGFTGHYGHALSGLALALHRGYDADLARWISSDPIGDIDGPNRYLYVLNNPINRVDPLGLQLSFLFPKTRNETSNGIHLAWLSCLKGDTRLWFQQTPVRRTLSREDANVHLRAAEKKCYTDKPPDELRYLYYRESLNYGGGAAFICCSRKLTCP
jgi:RHS repeat-associated protein